MQSISPPQIATPPLLSVITENLEECVAKQNMGVNGDGTLTGNLLSKVKESAADSFDAVSLHTLQLSDVSRFCRRVVDVCYQEADSVVARSLRLRRGGYAIMLSPCLGRDVRIGGLIVFASRMGKSVHTLFSQSDTLLIAVERCSEDERQTNV